MTLKLATVDVVDVSYLVSTVSRCYCSFMVDCFLVLLHTWICVIFMHNGWVITNNMELEGHTKIEAYHCTEKIVLFLRYCLNPAFLNLC